MGLQQKRRRSSGRIKCGGEAFGGKAETVLLEEQVSGSSMSKLRAFTRTVANGDEPSSDGKGQRMSQTAATWRTRGVLE